MGGGERVYPSVHVTIKNELLINKTNQCVFAHSARIKKITQLSLLRVRRDIERSTM